VHPTINVNAALLYCKFLGNLYYTSAILRTIKFKAGLGNILEQGAQEWEVLVKIVHIVEWVLHALFTISADDYRGEKCFIGAVHGQRVIDWIEKGSDINTCSRICDTSCTIVSNDNCIKLID